MASKVMHELFLQRDCWIWWENEFTKAKGIPAGFFRRVKNELDNHPRKTFTQMQVQLNENRQTGIVSGTWDGFFMVEPIIWIEFKIKGNYLSDAQKAFKERGEELGWIFQVAYNLTDFKNIVYGIF